MHRTGEATRSGGDVGFSYAWAMMGTAMCCKGNDGNGGGEEKFSLAKALQSVAMLRIGIVGQRQHSSAKAMTRIVAAKRSNAMA